jgi:hypothetical protein
MIEAGRPEYHRPVINPEKLSKTGTHWNNPTIIAIRFPISKKC